MLRTFLESSTSSEACEDEPGCDIVCLELWPLWAHRARVSQRRDGIWRRFRDARAPAGSRTEHGVAPARQVLSLWRAEPHGTVCAGRLRLSRIARDVKGLIGYVAWCQ